MATTELAMSEGADVTRRDFLYVASGALAAIGAAAACWPLIDQMNPSADVLALSSIDVDISSIEVGQTVTVMWRRKPVFVRHRTPKEIKEAEDVKQSQLIDPATDASRVIKPEWLVIVGICTHLGCVPLGQEGDYDGWLCPCHGSEYDSSGRVRRGPAPKNMAVPPYKFLNDTTIKIG